MAKGYMFAIDVTFAILLLIISLSIMLLNFSPNISSPFFTQQLSGDIIGVLSFTNTQDLCFNPGTASGCSCPVYTQLEDLVCNDLIQNSETNLLSLMNEVLETRVAPGSDVEDLIRQIFVEKRVIDEDRFGFAILYTDPITTPARELYNTEVPP